MLRPLLSIRLPPLPLLSHLHQYPLYPRSPPTSQLQVPADCEERNQCQSFDLPPLHHSTPQMLHRCRITRSLVPSPSRTDSEAANQRTIFALNLNLNTSPTRSLPSPLQSSAVARSLQSKVSSNNKGFYLTRKNPLPLRSKRERSTTRRAQD